MTTAEHPEAVDRTPVPLDNHEIDKWLADRRSAAESTMDKMLAAREEDPDGFDTKKFAIVRYQLSAFIRLRELLDGVFGRPPILGRFEDPEAEFLRIMLEEGYVPRNSNQVVDRPSHLNEDRHKKGEKK